MTLQQIEERNNQLSKTFWAIGAKYGMDNSPQGQKAVRVGLLILERLAYFKQQALILTTPQPKYPEGTL